MGQTKGGAAQMMGGAGRTVEQRWTREGRREAKRWGGQRGMGPDGKEHGPDDEERGADGSKQGPDDGERRTDNRERGWTPGTAG